MDDSECVLPKDSFDKVVDKAYGLWSSYANDNRDEAVRVLEKDIWQVFGRQFFFYVAEICLTQGYEGKAQIVFSKNLHSQKKAPSWLLHKGNDVPYIIIDKNYISGIIKDNEFPKIVLKLILHEVGHLALHWYALKANAGQHVTSASRQDEMEAWQFSATIWGLALGAKVGEGRRKGIIDCAWPLA